jgi:hypothetical protein
MQRVFQAGRSPFCEGNDEGIEKPFLFARANRSAPPVAYVFARASNKLSRIRFGRSQDVGNLIVGIVKRFS